MEQLSPLTASTAENPYPYYARLVAGEPFFRDDSIRMWVATSATAVEAVLASPVMRVRPVAEPVPEAIAGTIMADVFSRLARMTDGPQHANVKRAMLAYMETIDYTALQELSRSCAAVLLSEIVHSNASLASYVLGLPAFTISMAFGLSLDESMRAIDWTKAFVESIAPACTAEQIAAGGPATHALDAALRCFLGRESTDASVFGAFFSAAKEHNIDESVTIANAIGFLFQSHDATAGLIGNTLVALGRDTTARSLCDAVRSDRRLLEGIIDEVARYDAPVQNTRRYAAQDAKIGESNVREGDVVLVALAAANRDPSANRDPDRFDAERTSRRTYTFGLGPHACPGARIASAIAYAGVSRLIEFGVDFDALAVPTYRPLVNARIPDFSGHSLSVEVAR